MDEKKAQGRKRKRRTDRKQIKQENEEPTAKRLKITIELPAELLLEIFKSLTPTDLIMVGRVCRFWNECASGTSCWRLYSTCYVEPTGISWEVDRYFREHAGFLLADVKYIAPNEILANRNVHSFELSHKGEYLARYEISVHIHRNGFLNTTFIRWGTLNILEDFVSNDPESNTDSTSWAIEARIVPVGDTNNSHYEIAFSLYFNELTLLSSLRNKRKFPKQAMLLNKIDRYPTQYNFMYHQYWSITNHPCEPVLVSRDIFGDSIDLFDHQYRAINWMLYIEGLSHVTYSTLLPSTKSPNIFIDQSTNELVPIDDIEKYQVAFKPKGGILADDYGLGKTISAICLVLADKKLNNIAVDLPAKNGDRFSSNATLVICPALLVDQWQIDIAQFSELTAMVVCGPNQILNEAADIILLSDRLVEEYFKIGSPLFNTTFRRIILDESHILLKFKEDIYWHQNSLGDTLQLLSKTYGWCLSTTPFPDEYESTKFFTSRCKSLTASTMEFLEFPKLATVSRWDTAESTHLKDNIDTIRYNQQWTMMSTLMWCTKRDQLPEFNVSSTSETVRIELTPFEQAIVESQEKTTAIAVMTGIICFHKPLDALKEEEQKDLSKLQGAEGSSERISNLDSIPFLAADPNVDAKTQMVNLFGSKLAAIITWVKENIIEKNKKCIMFSKYPYFLRYISFSLDHYNIDSIVLDTSYVDQAPANQRLKEFRQAKHGVLLLQFDTKLISGLHFKDVEYIVPLDVLNEALTVEDSNFKLALGRVTSIGAGSREIKRVKFIVNHNLDEVWSDFMQSIDYVMARWMNLL